MMKYIRFSLVLFSAFLLTYLKAGIPPVSADGEVVSLAPMLKLVTPAVVNISVSTPSPIIDNPLFNDPFFRQFFDLPEARPNQSAGSGVIIDANNGIIVTNHHVISRASEIKVILKDRREFNAQLIGIDPRTDLAVIKIPPNQLLAIPMGDSDKVEVGDFVAAIGNPFAIGQTVTSGIISALGRSGINMRNFEDFIQTDAAINPGNSGGALVNLKGELIGINSNIISPAGASAGIGFAIPVNMVKAIVSQIREHGKVERGIFGIQIQNLNPNLAENFGISQTNGAVVNRVVKDSSAEKSGIKVGDVIIEINQIKILNANHLRSQLALIPPNNKFRLKIFRQNKIYTINSVMNPPISQKLSQGFSNKSPSKDIGITFANNKSGVVIAKISKNTAAASWGVKVGDLVISINGKKIKSTSDIPKLDSNNIDITLRRNNSILKIIRR